MRINRKSLVTLWAALAAGYALLTGLPSCNYAVNTTAVQCTSEKDCLDKGFANSTCDANTKTCVPVNGGAGHCEHNSDCIAQNNGVAAICRKTDKKCAVLQSTECPDVFGDVSQLQSDKAIVLGALTPLVNQLGISFSRSVKLAQADFVTQVGGLPSFDNSQGARPVVFVSCNEFSDPPNGLLRATNHLVKDLLVPATVGPWDPSNSPRALTQSMLPNGVMGITPGALALSGLSQLGPNPAAPTPLFWRASVSDEGLGQATGQFIGSAELNALLTSRGIKASSSEPLRVMFAKESSLTGASIAGQVLPNLTYDNQLATQHDPSTFRLVDIGAQDPVAYPAPATIWAQNVLAPAYQMKPHVILLATNTGYGFGLIPQIESQWDVQTGGAPRPLYFWIIPSLTGFLQVPNFAGNPTLKSRIFTLSSTVTADPAAQSEWVTRFNQANPDIVPPFTTQSISPLLYSAYDSTYILEYAITAVGAAPLTGVNLTNALAQKLASNGQDISDNPSDIPKALGILSSGGAITLNGLSGRLQFNPQTGGRLGDLLVRCVNIDPNNNVVYPPSGITWDSTTLKLKGALQAPCN